MTRTCCGLALLAGSWLFGLGYYHPPNWSAWSVMVALGAVLLSGTPLRLPSSRQAVLAALLLVPAAWFMPWPYRAAPAVMILGLALARLPAPQRWPEAIGRGAVAAGVVLMVQALAMLGYTCQTARSHDLPWPLPHLVGLVARLLGADVVVSGKFVVMSLVRQVHRLAATWELLVDPVTLLFLVGGLVWLGMAVAADPPQRRWSGWLRLSRQFALAILLWLPIRVGLLVAFLLQRAVRADPAVPLSVMNQFLSGWVHLALLAGAVLLAWRLIDLVPHSAASSPRLPGNDHPHPAKTWRPLAAAALAFLSFGAITVAVCWEPIGQARAGRVMVVERHSAWEPTDRPYDTSLYGQDGSYTCLLYTSPSPRDS